MRRRPATWSLAVLAALAAVSCTKTSQSQVERGRYLVAVAGCSDCHTPGGFSPKPDMARYLAGSDTSFYMVGQGVFTPSNLTPDRDTGLGRWTEEEIATAVTTGVTPSGRILSPAMPWPTFAKLSKADAMAVAAFLKTIPAVANKIPDPGPDKPCIPGAVFCIVRR